MAGRISTFILLAVGLLTLLLAMKAPAADGTAMWTNFFNGAAIINNAK